MATEQILSRLRTGGTFLELLDVLKDIQIDGKKVQIEVDARSVPYLRHIVAGFTDGPAASAIEAVLSGKDPAHDKWRRFTIHRERPGVYRLAAFPTPFNNHSSPLSPGIPPSASPHEHSAH